MLVIGDDIYLGTENGLLVLNTITKILKDTQRFKGEIIVSMKLNSKNVVYALTDEDILYKGVFHMIDKI